MTRLLGLVLLTAGAAPATADEVALPPGNIVGGFVEDGGTTVLLSREERDDGIGDSTILRIAESGTKVESFELPNTRVESLRLLEGGRLLLGGSNTGAIAEGRHAASVREVVKLRADEVVTLWAWEQPDCPDRYRGNHGCVLKGFKPPLVSGDGKTWGDVWPVGRKGAEFTFGRTKKKGGKPIRTEVVEFDTPDMSEIPGPHSFWFLDSEGQAVMVPWSGGAYIVHFSDGGSPYTVPVLQGGDPWSGGSALYWQRGDRLLWAGSPTGEGRWRACHLWDLGLSGLPAEPFWEVERKDGWKPHPERGVVRVVEGEHGYRIEQLWREPWTAIEEHHVSDWQSGSAPPSVVGNGWLVSPNGRHAAVIGTRQLEDEDGGGVALSARSVDMRWEPRPPPPIEATEPPSDDDTEPAQEAPTSCQPSPEPVPGSIETRYGVSGCTQPPLIGSISPWSNNGIASCAAASGRTSRRAVKHRSRCRDSHQRSAGVSSSVWT